MPSISGALGGAASGAAMGSKAGPWGALAGGAIGGVAGLFSGGKSKEEEELLKKQRELADFQLDTSKRALSPALKYSEGILSGNPSERIAAVEPEVRSVLGQYDVARKVNAEFAPRGGGRTRAATELPYQQITAVQNILSKARPEAAKALTAIFSELNRSGSYSLSSALTGTQASERDSFERGASLGESVGELLNSLFGEKGPFGKKAPATT